jgi:colanic acid/amylovoran biosynthesis glycosyltransferase
MKIAFFVDKFPLVSETFVLAQVAGMIRRGHDVTIFANTLLDPEVRHPALEQYDLIDKTVVRPTVAGSRLGRAAQGVRAMAEAARTGRLGAALATLNVFRRGRAALSMTLLSRAAVHFSHGDFDVLHCQFGQLGIEVAELRNCGVLKGKLVTSFRGADATIREFETHNKFHNLFATGDWFLAVSDSIRDRLVELGCPAEKIQVLRSGIDLSTFNFREPQELHSPLRLVTIGRLAPTKGIEYALEAVRKLVDEGYSLEYRIIGDGPRREALVDAAARLDLGSIVTFLPPVSSDEVARMLGETDVLVAPSIVAPSGQTEGVPNVLKEAMASGVPAIGTNVGGVAELIDHGTNGFLVSQKDPEAIADCIRAVVAQQDELPKILSRARRSIERDYDLQRLNADLETVYLHAGKTCC